MQRLPLMRIAVSLLAGAAAASCAAPKPAASPSGLTIATWNLEHLAEANGSGCRPRTDADYAALRLKADEIAADVIAFQEVESIKAAERVFDPSKFAIAMETRTGTPGSKPPCNGAPGLRLNRQAVGFAVRKGVVLARHGDVSDLQLGDPNLRSGVDVTVSKGAGPPLRLLAVHLKSGCARASQGPSCEAVARQVRVLKTWVETRAATPGGFAILGDFNRTFVVDDPLWATLDGVGTADLTDMAGNARPGCDPRYATFIDHIVTSPDATTGPTGFEEVIFEGTRLSDHCPIKVSIRPEAS